jgi:predicted dehydrogenase
MERIMKPAAQRKVSRRGFLRDTAAVAVGAAVAPYVITSAALGKDGVPAASERVTLGHIGVGSRGNQVLGGFLGLKDCQSLAVADAFTDRRDKTAERINQRAGSKICTPYHDFRELLARQDIDGVVVATPDHWHVPILIAAAKAGKDMYVEKPLGLCLDWDLQARAAVKQYGRVFQYGTQQRSSEHCRLGCELVLNGLIGELKSIEVHAPAGASGGSTTPIPVPEGFDYDLWLGPAPVSPYTKDRCTSGGSWYVYDNSIGFLGGWGAHPLDIAVWPLRPEQAVPIEYQGTGKIPAEGLFNTVTNWDIRGKYASGVEFIFKDGSDLTIFTGAKGSVSVSRGGLKSDPATLAKTRLGPDAKHLQASTNHGLNFIDAIKTRNQPVSNIDDAVRSDTISHLSDIAIRTGRKIKWDWQAETIVGDDQAGRMLRRALRAPWRL